jgi:hypothetical protein
MWRMLHILIFSEAALLQSRRGGGGSRPRNMPLHGLRRCLLAGSRALFAAREAIETCSVSPTHDPSYIDPKSLHTLMLFRQAILTVI